MKDNNPIFKAENLTKTYRVGEVEIHALRGVNLQFQESEFVVLLGPSGSGKSTLLNILGGLDQPSEGKVFYRDHDLMKSTETELTEYRRDHVGFIFQAYNLIPSLTSEENVRLVTDLAENPMRPIEALKVVGMDARNQHFPSQLSGGEQQRVAIARAISKRPDILLCDEPTGALDCATGRMVLKAINKVNEDLKTTVVVITHNAAIGGMADRIIHFANGQVSKIEENKTKISPDEISW